MHGILCPVPTTPDYRGKELVYEHCPILPATPFAKPKRMAGKVLEAARAYVA